MCANIAESKSRDMLALCLILHCTSSIGVGNAATTIYGYQDKKHDLHYTGVDRAFIGDINDPSGHALNWRGYSKVEGDYWSSITMISENYYITANHLKPGTAGSTPTVKFYQTPGSSTPFTTTIAEDGFGNPDGGRIGTTDLYIGRLDSTPPSWVPRYPLIKRPETYNYIGHSLISSEFFLVGIDSNPQTHTAVRVGRNEIAHSQIHTAISNYGGLAYGYSYDAGGGLGDDEARGESGDSGAPSFVVTASGLALAGIHTSSQFDQSVSALIDQITLAVPEPVQVVTDIPGDSDVDFDVDGGDLNVVLANFNQTNQLISDGDANGDGAVNSADLNLVLTYFGDNLNSIADFNGDWQVDPDDFRIVGDNWNQSVTAGEDGDANEDGFVDEDDVNVMNESWLFPTQLPNPSPVPVLGDATGEGLVNGTDIAIVATYLNTTASPPGAHGDVNFSGFVDSADLNIVLSNQRPGGIADLDLDGDVDGDDFGLLISNWGDSPSVPADGDLNNDDVVDADDFAVMGQYWGVGVSIGSLPLDPVPEPSSICMIASMGIAIVRPRRRS